MTKCYQYTADGYYAREAEDYGLLPNNATSTAPTLVDGHIPRWTGTAWEQVENHKGKTGYVNGEPFTVKEYGALPKGWSDTPPPPTLAEVQAVKRAKIAAGFDAAMSASLTMPSASAPPSSFAVATALYEWRTEDAAGYADLLAIHTARRAELEAAVNAAPDAAAVNAVDVGFAV